MQMLTAVTITALAVSTSAGEPYASRLPLGSLKAACTLEKRQLGTGPFFESVWLKCDAAPVLLVHPLNLVDKVAITSEDQALEFERLFDRQSYFMALGIAEHRPIDASASNGWRVPIHRGVTRAHLRPPTRQTRVTGMSRPLPKAWRLTLSTMPACQRLCSAARTRRSRSRSSPGSASAGAGAPSNRPATNGLTRG